MLAISFRRPLSGLILKGIIPARARISTWLYRIALIFVAITLAAVSTKEGKLTESLVIRSEDGEEHDRDIATKSANPAEIAQTNEALLLLERSIQALHMI